MPLPLLLLVPVALKAAGLLVVKTAVAKSGAVVAAKVATGMAAKVVTAKAAATVGALVGSGVLLAWSAKQIEHMRGLAKAVRDEDWSLAVQHLAALAKSLTGPQADSDYGRAVTELAGQGRPQLKDLRHLAQAGQEIADRR